MKELVVFLVGPTGIGKTKVSISLAKRIGAEIVSCDSMQVYKGMDIGTSKPPAELMAEVPHHMIDIIEPGDDSFSVAKFREMSLNLIKDIHQRGRIPLFVGGSGLYMNVLVDGLFPSPKANRNLRTRLKEEARLYGSKWLYDRLERIDPRTAAIIHPNDLRRIIRALELYQLTGLPMSRLKEFTRGITSEYEVRIFGLNTERRRLYKRIDTRVDRMFEDGLIQEVRRLKDSGMGMTARQVLGYKEIIGYLEGGYPLEEARALLKRNTRRYAKRQLSWFRRDKRIKWIYLEAEADKEKVAGKILASLGKTLSATKAG